MIQYYPILFRNMNIWVYLSLFPSTEERNKQFTGRIIPSGRHGNSIPAERRFPILTKDDGLGSRWDDEHLWSTEDPLRIDWLPWYSMIFHDISCEIMWNNVNTLPWCWSLNRTPGISIRNLSTKTTGAASLVSGTVHPSAPFSLWPDVTTGRQIETRKCWEPCDSHTISHGIPVVIQMFWYAAIGTHLSWHFFLSGTTCKGREMVQGNGSTAKAVLMKHVPNADAERHGSTPIIS